MNEAWIPLGTIILVALIELWLYLPVMRGLIRHQREEASIVVTGLVKWYVVAAAFVFAVWFDLIQGVRFWRLANALTP